MSKSYQLGVVLLSAITLVAFSNSPTAFGQRLRNGGGAGSNQGSKEKKDKDDDDKDKKDKKDQGQSGNQGSNQGNNSNGQAGSQKNFSGGSKPANSNKTGNSNSTPQFPGLIQGGKNQGDKGDKKDKDDDDKDHKTKKVFPGQDNQGQGDKNKIFGPGQGGFPNNKGSNSQIILGTNGPSLAEPANKKTGYWKGDRWQGSRKMDNWSQVFGHNKKPFTAEWYNDHPRAWRYNNSKSNVWVVATVPGVYAWLGWGDVPQQYRVQYNNGPRFDPSLYGEWYPLGVYSLMNGPDDVGTRILQLAVDRRGRISGNYYDMITDSDNSVSGQIQQETQRADWIINQNPNVRFRSSIFRLLQPEGSITVQLPGGEQRWQFVRLEN